MSARRERQAGGPPLVLRIPQASLHSITMAHFALTRPLEEPLRERGLSLCPFAEVAQVKSCAP